MTKVSIKENSWLARIAARKLNCTFVAMVIGRTIYLHNSSKEEFMQNQQWVSHEVAHVKQYRRLGILRFLALYFVESVSKGYYNNKFEVEARQKEKDPSILSEIYFA